MENKNKELTKEEMEFEVIALSFDNGKERTFISLRKAISGAVFLNEKGEEVIIEIENKEQLTLGDFL